MYFYLHIATKPAVRIESYLYMLCIYVCMHVFILCLCMCLCVCVWCIQYPYGEIIYHIPYIKHTRVEGDNEPFSHCTRTVPKLFSHCSNCSWPCALFRTLALFTLHILNIRLRKKKNMLSVNIEKLLLIFILYICIFCFSFVLIIFFLLFAIYIHLVVYIYIF